MVSPDSSWTKTSREVRGSFPFVDGSGKFLLAIIANMGLYTRQHIPTGIDFALASSNKAYVKNGKEQWLFLKVKYPGQLFP